MMRAGRPMNPSRATPCRIACRIGPVVLAAEDPARPIALAPAEPETPALERALGNFAVPDGLGKRTSRTPTTSRTSTELTTAAPTIAPNLAAPDLVLQVERGAPCSRPDAPAVFRHRAGWDVYRRENTVVAIKAIPYGGDRVLRSVEMGLDGGAATLRIAPEDDRSSFPFAYTVSELLVLLLTRRSRAMLVHSACVEVSEERGAGKEAGGRVLLFAGTSGSGKSTLAALWEKSGRGSRVLGDESHLVWSDAEGRVWVSGTPWPGSSGLFSNRVAPLERVFFLEHGQENVIQPLDAADAMTTLLSQSYLPTWDADSLRAVTDLSARIAGRVPASRLAFVPDKSVVEFLRGVFRETRRK